MIWDYIRDFIVQYITGGTTSLDDSYNGFIGSVYGLDPDYGGDYAYTSEIFVPFKGNLGGNEMGWICFGDWLATTITVVIMVLLVVFAVWLVRWVFRAVTSAFLLR